MFPYPIRSGEYADINGKRFRRNTLIHMKQVFEFIVDSTKTTGHPPSYREIQVACDFSSVSVVSYYVDKLIAIGLVTKQNDDNTSRNLIIPGAEWKPPDAFMGAGGKPTYQELENIIHEAGQILIDDLPKRAHKFRTPMQIAHRNPQDLIRMITLFVNAYKNEIRPQGGYPQ